MPPASDAVGAVEQRHVADGAAEQATEHVQRLARMRIGIGHGGGGDCVGACQGRRLPLQCTRLGTVHQAGAGDRMLDRHVRAVALHVADDGHFQFGAGARVGWPASVARTTGPCAVGIQRADRYRGRPPGSDRVRRFPARTGAARHWRPPARRRRPLLRVVDDVDPLQADVGFHLARRQRPRQVGGDHGAVLAGVAGAGDHAVRGPRAFAQEVGQDRAETGMVGVAVLRYSAPAPGGRHRRWPGPRPRAHGCHRRQRPGTRRNAGQDMGRGGVAGGHAGSCCQVGPARNRGGDCGGVCNRADNDVNEFVTLSLLRCNERGV